MRTVWDDTSYFFTNTNGYWTEEDYGELIYFWNNFENIGYNHLHVQWVDNTEHENFNDAKNLVYCNGLIIFCHYVNDTYLNDHSNNS